MRILLLVIVAAVLGIGAGLGMAYRRDVDQGVVYRQLMEALSKEPVVQEISHDRVVVENGAEFDFGVMAHNDTKSHTFRIRNNTDQPLKLTIVEKTCKCTVGRLPDDSIPPGEIGEVVLEWTAKQFEADFRQSAVLETSDPIQSTISLVVIGHVMQLVNVVPPSLAFTDVSFGADAEQILTIQSYEDAEFRVERITWLNDDLAEHFDITFEPVKLATTTIDDHDDDTDEHEDEDEHDAHGHAPTDHHDDFLRPTRMPVVKSEWLAKVRMKAGMPLGMFDQRLALHTNSPSLERIDIPLMGNVVSDVQIVGPGYRARGRILELGVVPAKEGLKRELKLLVKGPESSTFEISDVTTDPADRLHVTVGEPREIQSSTVRYFPLEISIPAGSPTINRLGSNGRPTGRIVLRTTHSVDQEIVIDARFAIVDR